MKRTTISERALILAPRGRDAAIAQAILTESGISADACHSLPHLVRELDRGAAAVVLTEESLANADLRSLAAWIADQEEWSDLPFVLLTSHGGGLERNPAARRYLDVLGNATLIERPFHPTTLISSVRSALRGRRRQYGARARLEALRESETRLRLATENAEIGFWDVDPIDGALIWPARVKAMFGISPDVPVTMQDFYEGLHPTDQRTTAAAYAAASDPQQRALYDVEYRTIGKEDGVLRWVAAKGRGLFDDAGRCVRVVGTAIDITARKNVDAALRESEARLSFLDRLGAETAPLSDADAVLATTTRLLGEHLNLSVCAYADMDEDEDGFTIRGDWAAPGCKSIVGHYSLADFGKLAVKNLSAGLPLVVNDNLRELAPEEAATFQNIGIAATICMPLVKEGRLTALMAIHDRVPRVWIEAELSLLREVTARSWAHVERVATVAELRESESRFRHIADAAPVLIWISDTTKACTWFNRPWLEFTGRTMHEECGCGWARGVHPDDLDRCVATYNEAFNRREPFRMDCRLRRYDGDYRVVDYAGVPRLAENDGFLGYIGACTDVTEARRAEQALRELNETLERRVADRTADLVETQRRFRGIFDSALQFMALLTPTGSVIEVNETALAWSQITPPDIVGKPFWLAAPMRGNPELQAAIRTGIRRAAAGETVREEHEMRGAGEVRAIVDFSLKPVPGERGEAIWLIAEGRDITELKRAQDALRQAQKLEAVGQLTGGVAHDFNNLLTIIRSSTDLLRKPGLPEERRRRYVDAIADTVDRAARLTGQLLAFARRQSLKPEVFDPAQRVRSIIDMLRTVVGSRIEIVTEVTCEACFVKADASQFETALVNIAVNARDAMNGEGRLTLKVADEGSLPPIRGHAGGPGQFVAVSITDTGHGIPADRLTQIFEPFFTTKEVGKGTGLGLSQVYGFAKQSGGDVTVDSDVGRRTTFTLYLPRADAAEAFANSSDAPGRPAIEDGRGHRVLVVEDNMDVGAFSTQLLQDLGYDTAWAANADEALQLLSGSNEFDVVFSDVVMPGKSGVELGREIRRRYPGLPVVLTSGYSHVLAEEGRHGFELLQKPYAAEELSRVLRRVTRVARPRD